MLFELGGDLLHRLELDRDLDLLADEHAARLERRVPGEAELAAVERGLGGEGDNLFKELSYEPQTRFHIGR